ncbi:hypothetical protein AHF37_05127 [Paragonimus kellicotti]|nr:hypothetical protein AHF37_05127 [Paragonimus kellicotti]
MMMRPACAYPPVIQSGLPIGPTDMYGDRDGFGFGLMTNQPPASMQTMSSTPAGLYPVPSNGPTTVLSSANPQTFSQQLHSTYPVSAAYSQLPVQSAPYSTQLSTDIMNSGGQLPHGYPQTQQSAQYSNLMNANHEKLISQNLPTTGYTRNVGLTNGPNMSMPSSYGLISGPGPNSVLPLQSASAQLPPQRLPPGGSSMGSSGNGRTILPQTTMSGRSAGSRAASGLPDSNGFSSQSMYNSYPSGGTPLQSVTAVGSGPGGGHNVQVPYSIAMSNSGIPVTMSSMLNKTSMLSVASYGPSQPMSVQNVPGPVGRPSVMAPGIQPSPVYASQQPRISSASANYAATGFVGQPYAQSPSVSFRTGTHTVVGAPPQSVSMLSRPMDPSSPLTNKEQLGSNCMGMHPCVVQPQQQRPSLSSQLPPCSSAPSSGSPNPCASFSPVVTGKSLRPAATATVGQAMFNSMTSCGPHASVTPPGCAGGLLINGQSAVIGTMNGCMTIGGQETDVKLTSGIPDGCYLTNRPMSSGTRDPHLSIMTVNGPIGSGSDLLISPTFPMSNNLNASAAMSYATNQQIPVLSGEFDVLSSNPSPMMMMAMPSSSPVPGATLINGGLPAGVMMANSTPAPPPYHHQSGSLAGCRSMGPSSFFSPSGMPPVTITTSVHMNTAPTICAPSHDGSGMGVGVLTNERTYLNVPVEPMQVVTGGKSAQPGTTKPAARPKRTRANKNTSGGVRASKANAKKTATAAASAATPPAAGMATLPVQDPFVMNIRMPMQAQQTARQKLPTWNMYPSSVATNFPSGMISPPMSMTLSADGRPGCSSPASFSTCNGMLMRPNSGPPLNPSFTGMPHGGCQMMPTGPADVINRLSSSPRLYSSVPMQPPQPQQQQQQHYLNSSLPTSVSPVGASFSGVSVSHSSQPPNTMTLTNPASHPQLQSGYPGNVQMTSARVVSTSMHFQPQTTGSLQVMASNQMQAPNRTLLQSATHTPTTSPYTVEPTSVGERLVGTQYATSGAPLSSSTDMPPSTSTSDTDRLVCPITNGMVWGPTQIQLTDVLHHFLPDGVYVRRFEFDLTANHLNTIVGRSDLDIVVCSHLLSEPLQVCHWPSDAVQIRFNEFLLRLDRGSVSGGQSAHKVACVKQLCRPGRNQLEIAILGLGEDPGQPATINKRRITAATLETHRFAAFMAHMPALNVLLDGLKRRRPAGVSALCDIIEGRAGLRASSAGSGGGPTPPPRTTPLVAELSLICPVFRTRMNVPGRITGCEHVEAFDMEAFLRREVLWPRLNCPICRHKSPAGLDGLCITRP